MDGATLRQIRDALLAKWKKLTIVQEKDFYSTQDFYNTQTEIIDMAQALEQLGRETSLQEAERPELLAIERALAKMATGNFGVCEDCGEDIPSKRLAVLPEARLCANCQAYEERQSARSRVAS